MAGLIQDLGHAVRGLWRRPGLSAAAILTLAIGIAANAAVFGFARAFVLRPLPFPDAARLVHVWQIDRSSNDLSRVSLPNVRDWQARSASFEELGLFNYSSETIVGPSGPSLVPVGRVSANVMRILGARPILGRTFQSGEDLPGRADVIVLSYGMWQAEYGGRADVLGTTITLDQRPRTIVGVMGPDFQFPLNITRLWVPYELHEQRYPRATRSFQVVGRLKAGTSIDQAEADLGRVAHDLEREWPDVNRYAGVEIVPLQQALNFAYDVLEPMSAMLGVGVALVLGLACANVAGLLLAAAGSRLREMAIRTALGATRGRLLGQLVIEALALAVPGGALGLLLAYPAMRAIDVAVPPDIYRVGAVTVDGATVVLAAGLSVGAAIVASLAPALRLSAAGRASIREGVAVHVSRRARWFQNGLVVTQVALALVLVAGSVLTFRSVVALRKVQPGFQADRVLTAQLVLPRNQFADPARVTAFHDALLEAATTNPRVRAAATVNYLPLNHEVDYREFRTEGSDPSRLPRTAALHVSDAFFETIGIPILRGRTFRPSDARPGILLGVINIGMAERFWPGGDAVGRQFELETSPGSFQAVEVIGVAANAALDDLARPAPWQLYLSQRQSSVRYFRLLLQGDSVDHLTAAARSAVASVDRGIAITEIRMLAAVMDEYLLPQRMVAVMLLTLASVALVLAVVGLHGLVAFFVAQHTRDIGIRVALGAGPADVARIVLGRTTRLVGSGIAAGSVLVLAGGRLLGTFLFGVTATDPLTFVVLAALFAAAAGAAAARPLHRALGVDPMIALRAE